KFSLKNTKQFYYNVNKLKLTKMGKVTGFFEYERVSPSKEAPQERLNHYNEFANPLPVDELNRQSGRCMDCGVPFCQSGCPLGNVIPEFNDAVYQGKWL